MWGVNLSVPLCIVALVSRYLTNQLIQRMPIHNHRSFQPEPMPVLMLWGISTNFSVLSPVMGRLHTRYAPVRRSPPVYCYTVLPLDLHVLGLPLAFILSQDQTLHCKKMFCYKSLALISKVLFEITLLQEWKKLLAAQILQRTLFNILL